MTLERRRPVGVVGSSLGELEHRQKEEPRRYTEGCGEGCKTEGVKQYIHRRLRHNGDNHSQHRPQG